MKPPKRKITGVDETLSRRVSQLREKRNLTMLDLARNSKLPLKRIEAIESGQEIWLSVTDRTKLSRALGVPASVLQEVEVCPSEMDEFEQMQKQEMLDSLDELADRILAGEVNIACPKCSATMKTAIENALDFEGNPVRYARAYCPVCPFSLR